MGMNASAYLAYGYDLGGPEEFKAAERGEYGEPNLPWLTDDDDEGEHDDFGTEAEKILRASVGFTETDWQVDGYFDRQREADKRTGVGITYSGHADYPGWLLIAKGSKRSVSWAEAMELDPVEMSTRPHAEGWDGKLSAALTALGIAPTQDGPKWLVFPSYG